MNFTVGSAGFNSQFNGDATGWEVHSGTWWIASSQWYTTQGVSGAWASTSYTANFLNFDYQVRLWRNGCDGCANAILVRGAPEPLSNGDWHSAYAFQYTRDGYYSIWKNAGEDWSALQEWTYTSAINKGGAWNTLRVVANGSNLYFYINGTLVWSGSDTSLSSGRVGIEMYSDGTSGDQLWADWAVLTTNVETITDTVSDEQQALNEAANRKQEDVREMYHHDDERSPEFTSTPTATQPVPTETPQPTSTSTPTVKPEMPTPTPTATQLTPTKTP